MIVCPSGTWGLTAARFEYCDNAEPLLNVPFHNAYQDQAAPLFLNLERVRIEVLGVVPESGSITR